MAPSNTLLEAVRNVPRDLKIYSVLILVMGNCSLSQFTLDEREGTLWTGLQSIGRARFQLS